MHLHLDYYLKVFCVYCCGSGIRFFSVHKIRDPECFFWIPDSGSRILDPQDILSRAWWKFFGLKVVCLFSSAVQKFYWYLYGLGVIFWVISTFYVSSDIFANCFYRFIGVKFIIFRIKWRIIYLYWVLGIRIRDLGLMICDPE